MLFKVRISALKAQSLKLYLFGMKIGRMENRVENAIFTVWFGKENREERKLERKFSLLGPHFLSSQTGRKIWEEKCFHSIITQIPSPTYPHSWPDDPLTYPTWWLFAHKSSLSLFCLFSSYLHQCPAVQVLFSFFFFFPRDLIKILCLIKFICTLL